MHKIFKNDFYIGSMLICLTALGVYFIYTISSVIISFIIATIIYVITKPLINFLRRQKINKFYIPNSLIAILIISIFFLIIVLIVYYTVPPLILQAQKAQNFLMEKSTINILNSLAQEINQWAKDKGFSIDLKQNISHLFNQIVDITYFTKHLNSIINALSNIFFQIFAAIFIAFFMIKQPFLITGFIKKNLAQKDFEKYNTIKTKVENLLRRYILGLCFQIMLLMIYYFLLLIFYKIPNALLIAFVVGSFNIIPYIGPLIGGSVLFILGFASLAQLGNGLDITQNLFIISKVLVCFGIIQIFDALISQPLIYSKSVKAHPLEIFLIVLIAGALGGSLGMILAIPIYTILRIIFKEFSISYKEIN